MYDRESPHLVGEKLQCIAGLARQYLGIPAISVSATSVPSERIFSTAGVVINKLRNRLSASVVDQIIFLNKNATTN